jgi:putative lipoic acid-binding regulatory protein
MDHDQAQNLLESTHVFPGKYMFKVVGWQRNDFVERVLNSARLVIGRAIEVQHTTRETTSGRHISVTMEPFVDNSDQVLEIYEHLKALDDVIMLW